MSESRYEREQREWWQGFTLPLLRSGLLLLVLALLLTAGACATVSWAASPEYARFACIRLSSHGGSATAIWTGPGKTIYLSANHMFRGADRTKPIRFEAPWPVVQTSQRQHFGTRVLDVDPASDLALWEWGYGPVPYVAPVAPAGTPHPRELLSIGYDGMTLPPQMRPARVIGTDAKRTLTDTRPWHGRSGGSLIDPSTGYLWGVVSGYSGPSNHREIVPGSHGIYASHTAIVALLRRNGIEPGGGVVQQQAPLALALPSPYYQPRPQPLGYGYGLQQSLPGGC